jgi:hypothetical protein
MWLYNNQPLNEVPENAYGYVYLITNLLSNKKYIGKKLFWFKKTKMVKGKKKRFKVESDWKDYWSSSEDVKIDVKKIGSENFKREILYICSNRGLCNYLEAREQMDRRVLESIEYYNGNIQCRIHRNHLKI